MYRIRKLLVYQSPKYYDYSQFEEERRDVYNEYNTTDGTAQRNTVVKLS